METTKGFLDAAKQAIKNAGSPYPEMAELIAERDRYREALGDAIKAAELAQESDSIRAGSMGDVEYGYFHEGPTVEELIEQSDALLNKARQALKGDT